MGLDFGSKTVGVAISDPLFLTAQGIEIVRRKSQGKLRQTLARIEELKEEYEVGKIVLGFPKNMNNTEGERCEKTLEFKEMLEKRTGLEVAVSYTHLDVYKRQVMNFKDAVEYAKLQDMILVPYENERGMEATREALKKVKPGQSISVFIGPEGGFSEEEIDALRQDAEVLSLGKRILRTDTAAICAMSMLMLELEEKTEGEC